MIIKATEQQAKQIAVNAIKESAPVGMGYMHFQKNQSFSTDQITVGNEGIFLDYVGGRMVKLQLFKKGEDRWELLDRKPTLDYQSWCRTYPTYQALAQSVEGVIIEEPAKA